MTLVQQRQPGLTVQQGLGVGAAEILALAQILATGSGLGLLVFGACNVVIGGLLLARAWRLQRAWVAVLAALLLVVGTGTAAWGTYLWRVAEPQQETAGD